MDINTTDLDKLIHLRDMLAQAFFRKQGSRYPLQEYISAGNLAIAEVLHESCSQEQLTDFVYTRIVSRMQNVRVRESGLFNNKRTEKQKGNSKETHYSIESLESYPEYISLLPNTKLPTPHKNGFFRILLSKVLLDLQTNYSRESYAYLALFCEEYTVREIAVLFQGSYFIIYRILQQMQQHAYSFVNSDLDY